MTKIYHILQGWANYLSSNPEVEKVAKARADICAGCDYASLGSYEQIMNDKIEKVKGMKCAHCGCPLSTKLRSLDSSCPIGKWESEIVNTEIVNQ